MITEGTGTISRMMTKAGMAIIPNGLERITTPAIPMLGIPIPMPIVMIDTTHRITATEIPTTVGIGTHTTTTTARVIQHTITTRTTGTTTRKGSTAAAMVMTLRALTVPTVGTVFTTTTI